MGIPWWFSSWDSGLLLLRAWVQSLVGNYSCAVPPCPQVYEDSISDNVWSPESIPRVPEKDGCHQVGVLDTSVRFGSLVLCLAALSNAMSGLFKSTVTVELSVCFIPLALASYIFTVCR